jgi:hypothetical protein
MGGIAEMSVGTCSVGHVMFPSGLHTGPALPLVGHTCMRTCEHAGLADLVGSRPHGRCRDVGCRTRCPSCDGALRPKHRRGPADFWHTCTWTCVQAGLADLVGSRLVGGIAEGLVGARGLGYVMLECTDRLTVVLTLTQYPEWVGNRSDRKGCSFPSTTFDLGRRVLAWTSTTAGG